MPDTLRVVGEVQQKAIVLTIHFGPEILLQKGTSYRLSSELLNRYQSLSTGSAPRTCIVEIMSDVAGSPLVRALFELWKEVNGKGGRLLCVNYPKDYIDSLTSLGLPSLPRFSLAEDRAEAFRLIAEA